MPHIKNRKIRVAKKLSRIPQKGRPMPLLGLGSQDFLDADGHIGAQLFERLVRSRIDVLETQG